MRVLLLSLAGVCFIWLSQPLSVTAYTTTLAVSGDSAEDVSGAVWEQFHTATLNNSTAIAFNATLQHNGSIATTNDLGTWLIDGDSRSLLAQTGAADAPGISGANFALLGNPALSDSGEVIISGDLVTGTGGITSSNNQGIWKFTNSGDSLLARSGTANVPGIPGANFLGFPNAGGATRFSIAAGQRVGFSARLTVGVGGVTTNNDIGIWSYDSGTLSPVAREGFDSVPGISGVAFKSFDLPSVNNNNQLALIGSFASLGVGNDSGTGIWRYHGNSGEMLARTGTGNVPNLPGFDFQTFESLHLNNSGQVAFSASTLNGPRGIWQYTDTTGTLVVSTDSEVPGVADAQFSTLPLTSMNDDAQILTRATLEPGTGGVTTSNNAGLWLFGDTDHLIARTGSGSVPDIPTANFASFAAHALNATGQVAFAAGLEIGVAGVDSSNDGGIWIADPAGDAQLVAREGDQLAGRTIASLDFAGDHITQSTGFNDHGELVFLANFTNGESGLFLYRPLAADFDRDGDVDAADLSKWQEAFATSPSGDADADGDTDGADFLAWQREFGANVTSLSKAVAVPEPTSWLLFAVGILTSGHSERRRK